MVNLSHDKIKESLLYIKEGREYCSIKYNGYFRKSNPERNIIIRNNNKTS